MRLRAGSAIVALLIIAAAPAVRAEEDSAPYTYVQASDGVWLAVSVGLPKNYVSGTQYPALFEMSGYAEAVTAPSQKDVVNVKVAQRGSGCSGGEFELFTDRIGRDGHEIIEDWLVDQPWSNGRVAVLGHSFSGLNGFVVAGTAPPHVEAVRLSGLIEDTYRGISYPGGVVNAGFPVLWTVLRASDDDEIVAMERRGLDEIAAGDPRCATNIASRPPEAPYPLQSAAHPFDDEFWRDRSLYRVASSIAAPIHITQSWQDQSTGPSGGILWELIPDDVPKRFVGTNGKHATFRGAAAERDAWLDCWLVLDGTSCEPDLVDPARRVRLHFETTGDAPNFTMQPPLVSSDFPLPDTDWTRLYFERGGGLSTETPAATGAETYAATPMDAGSGRQDDLTNTPDELVYETTFSETTAIAGPIAATLWLSSNAIDTDVYVAVADVSADGVQYLQRGLLRASHRALDEARSERIDAGTHAGEMFRPRHSHGPLDLQPLIPGEPARLDVEIFPVGHVFRPGHRLRIVVRTPPQTDMVGRSAIYGSAFPPTFNSIHTGGVQASSVLLPVLPSLPPMAAEPVPCGLQSGIRCDAR